MEGSPNSTMCQQWACREGECAGTGNGGGAAGRCTETVNTVVSPSLSMLLPARLGALLVWRCTKPLLLLRRQQAARQAMLPASLLLLQVLASPAYYCAATVATATRCICPIMVTLHGHSLLAWSLALAEHNLQQQYTAKTTQRLLPST